MEVSNFLKALPFHDFGNRVARESLRRELCTGRRQREAEHTSRREQFAADLAKSENALAQARREWQQAIEEAARKRQEAEAEDDGPARAEKPGDLMDRLQEQLSGVGEGLRQTQDKIGVTGTFNAAAVRGFSGGGPAERTAKASEETITRLETRAFTWHRGEVQDAA